MDYTIDDFELVGWPEIQYYMDEEGFEENATLVNSNPAMGIESSTYLIVSEWLDSLENQ